MTNRTPTQAGEELAKKVSKYFGNKPIPAFLDADLELRAAAREILGLKPIRAWKQGDGDEIYEGHKIHCPKCGYECLLGDLP